MKSQDCIHLDKKVFYEMCDWLFIMCSTKKAVLPAVTLSLFISSIQLNYC